MMRPEHFMRDLVRHLGLTLLETLTKPDHWQASVNVFDFLEGLAQSRRGHGDQREIGRPNSKLELFRNSECDRKERAGEIALVHAFRAHRSTLCCVTRP